MIEVTNRFELAKALVIDGEDEIIVKDPELIKYLIEKGHVKLPEPSSSGGPCGMNSSLSLELPPDVIEPIIEAIIAIAILICGTYLVKRALEKEYDVTIDGFNPETGKVGCVKFRKRREEQAEK